MHFKNDLKTLAYLEELGHEAVSIMLVAGDATLGKLGSDFNVQVRLWLRDAEASAKRDAREEETLSISRRAVAPL